MKNSLLTKSDLKIDRYYLAYLALIFSLFLFKVDPSTFLLIAGVLSTALFGWITINEYRSNTIKITPILAVALYPILMLGLAAFYKGFVYLNQDYETLGPIYISSKSIIIGYLMVATGLFFQLLGLQIYRPATAIKENLTINIKKLKIFRYFILFVIISKLTEEYLKLGVIQNLLNTIPLAILIFIAINDKNNLITTYYYKRNSIIVGAFILFIINIIVLSKTLLVFSILPIFLFYLVQTKRSNKFKIIVPAALAVILYFLFIQPLVTNARLLLGKQNQDVSTRFMSEYIASGDYKIPVYQGTNQDNAVESFLNRMFEINAPAYIYELTARSGFQNGRTFQNIAIGMIPRILWPNKPSTPQGQKFSSEYVGFDKVSIGMLIAGELYWNFGFIGIIIGSMFIGLALGFVWRLITPFALKNFFYFTFYFYLLQSSIGGSEFSAVFLGALQLIIVFFVLRFIDLNIINKR